MRKLAAWLCLPFLSLVLVPIALYARSTKATATPATQVNVSHAIPIVAVSPTPLPASTAATPAPAKPIATAAPSTSPYAELWIGTPLYSQGDLLGGVACAPTAVSMTMGYYAASLPSPSPAEFIKLVGTDKVVPGQGLPYNSMLQTLYGLGYHHLSGHENTSPAELAKDLQDGPVIITAGVNFTNGSLASGHINHSLVVIGVSADGSRYMVQDPYYGQRLELSAGTFNQIWAAGSNGIFVLRP